MGKSKSLQKSLPFVPLLMMSAFLLLITQQATAQNTQFRIFNQETVRPAPPTGLRVVSVNGVPVKPRVSYQVILDELSSDRHEIRERAALKLYNERNKHSYSIDLLVPRLKDDSELVTQYVSSAIVDVINKRAGTSRSLQGYFKDIYSTFNSSNDPLSRANCIALLSWATDDFEDINKIIVSSLINGSRYEFTNAAISVTHFAPKSIEVYRTLSDQLGSRKHDKKIIAEAMVNIALKFRNSNEGYNANRLLDGTTLLKRADSQALGREIGIIESIASSIASKASGGGILPTADSEKVYQVGKNFEWTLFDRSTINLNGKNVSIAADKSSNTIKFLGEEPLEGLNILDVLNVKYTVWMEDNVFRTFENPYKKSYAIIVAIDKYENTGYENLGNMVQNAAVLEEQLVNQVFLKENIFSLYNKAATSSAITRLLKDFWQGGRYSDADRLVFYFGGHGDYIERQVGAGDKGSQTGFLVTSDHNKNRPTASSLLMKDLTGSHFENIVSNHVLMLIDSCSSGLALPRFQSSDKDAETIRKFKKYVIIESEIKRPARNIIVAGTGAQKALWENGGIFTRSLISGLSGKSDFNEDGIIDFDELSLYLKNSVRAKAASTGVEQEPRSFKASNYGEGSVIFLGI